MSLGDCSGASPTFLQDLCIEAICDNLHKLCIPVTPKMMDTPYLDVYPPQFTILRFNSKEIYFYTRLAEMLLAKLSKKMLLTDQVMTLFDSRVTHLKIVKLSHASKLSLLGLRSLRGHKLEELEVRGLRKATVGDLLGILNDWTLANLHRLSVANCTFIDQNKFTIFVGLAKMKSLQSLNVSSTEFNKAGLEMVVSQLPSLEALDISLTQVNDIQCLRKCKNRLKSLSIHGIEFPSQAIASVAVEVILQLQKLRVLDISDKDPHEQNDTNLNWRHLSIDRLLGNPHSLPNLASLDVSGREVDKNILKAFVQAHSNLLFLGLVYNDTCFDMFFESKSPVLLSVAGNASEKQLVECLRRYSHRDQYIQNALNHLFRFTLGVLDPRKDLIQLVVEVSRTHSGSFPVQMAATACLYNLSKSELGKRMHPSILGQIVEVDLDAMERFPDNQQLQKNVLLTLCSDRILQDVRFDRFRCAKLVLDCLYTFQNHSMNRMSVAICSILAAKISTRETSQLGSSPSYMEKLLKLVRKRISEKIIDVTLKFTLSALWNLTDESPETCSVFLEEGGLELYQEILETFPDETQIQTKVLGLLNNIAEVEFLRKRLLLDDFVGTLSKLIHSKQIDVSYFAAGIVAHLTSSGRVDWIVTSKTKKQTLDELYGVVLRWEVPKDEMVTYRSFRPFFPLISRDQESAVQLWALWAIYQVLSKNPQRYRTMFENEGKNKVIVLNEYHGTNEAVRNLSEKILTIMDSRNEQETV